MKVEKVVKYAPLLLVMATGYLWEAVQERPGR